jgi:hypothetical protein
MLDRERLQALMEAPPDAYLGEYAYWLGAKHPTVAYNLHVMQISRNKTVRYRKRNESDRSQFCQVLQTLDPVKLVYLDESGLEAVWKVELNLFVSLPALYARTAHRETKFHFPDRL